MFGGYDNNTWDDNGNAKGFRIFDGYAATDADVLALYGQSTDTIYPIPSSMEAYLSREYLLNQRNSRTVLEKNRRNESLSNVSGWEDIDIIKNGNGWQ